MSAIPYEMPDLAQRLDGKMKLLAELKSQATAANDLHMAGGWSLNVGCYLSVWNAALPGDVKFIELPKPLMEVAALTPVVLVGPRMVKDVYNHFAAGGRGLTFWKDREVGVLGGGGRVGGGVKAKDVPGGVAISLLANELVVIGKALEGLGVALKKLAEGEDVSAEVFLKGDAGDVKGEDVRRNLIHGAMSNGIVSVGCYARVRNWNMEGDILWSNLPREIEGVTCRLDVVVLGERIAKDRSMAFAGLMHQEDAR